MFESRGRKSTEVYIDGGFYIAKKPLHISNSISLLLPKGWVDAVSMGRELTYLLLDVRDTQIVVKPYFDKLPMGVDE